MISKFAMIAVIPLALAATSCSFLQSLPPSTGQNVAECTSALLATGSTDPAALAVAASANSACMTLASDAVQLVIKNVLNHNIAAARAAAAMH